MISAPKPCAETEISNHDGILLLSCNNLELFGRLKEMTVYSVAYSARN
jgi:hypothetical protein